MYVSKITMPNEYLFHSHTFRVSVNQSIRERERERETDHPTQIQTYTSAFSLYLFFVNTSGLM